MERQMTEETGQLAVLLARARQEADEWLEKLELCEEDAGELLPASALSLFGPGERFSLESATESGADDASAEWYIGLAGHGWNNMYFCCRWRSSNLKISVQVSYQTPLTEADETAAEASETQNRKRMIGACSLVCLLLKLASEAPSFIENHAQLSVTVMFDNSGCAFSVRDADGNIWEDSSVDALLRWIDEYSMAKRGMDDMVIICG